jgi:hypothetical protein
MTSPHQEGRKQMKATKNVLSGILWLGRGAATMMGLVVVLALMLGVTTKALAGTGVGATFDLGRTNTVEALSRLVGSTNDALLRIDNANGETSATALDLRVEPGHAPMKVDSSTKVVGLNVDEVDGNSASDFLGANDKAAGATFADQADHADQAAKADDAAHAVRADRAANAGKVDGLSADEIGVNGLEQVTAISDSDSDSSKTATADCPEGKMVVGTAYSITGGESGTFPNAEANVVIDTVNPSDLFVTTTALEEEPTSANWALVARAICATAP